MCVVRKSHYLVSQKDSLCNSLDNHIIRENVRVDNHILTGFHSGNNLKIVCKDFYYYDMIIHYILGLLMIGNLQYFVFLIKILIIKN